MEEEPFIETASDIRVNSKMAFSTAKERWYTPLAISTPANDKMVMNSEKVPTLLPADANILETLIMILRKVKDCLHETTHFTTETGMRTNFMALEFTLIRLVKRCILDNSKITNATDTVSR